MDSILVQCILLPYLRVVQDFIKIQGLLQSNFLSINSRIASLLIELMTMNSSNPGQQNNTGVLLAFLNHQNVLMKLLVS